MPQWLRVTIGTQSENARFLAVLREALETAPGRARVE
jgi:histidinol-phosphate/aromatic aminotransferase/cobyric acid decarboxylase-like protein